MPLLSLYRPWTENAAAAACGRTIVNDGNRGGVPPNPPFGLLKCTLGPDAVPNNLASRERGLVFGLSLVAIFPILLPVGLRSCQGHSCPTGRHVFGNLDVLEDSTLPCAMFPNPFGHCRNTYLKGSLFSLSKHGLGLTMVRESDLHFLPWIQV